MQITGPDRVIRSGSFSVCTRRVGSATIAASRAFSSAAETDSKSSAAGRRSHRHRQSASATCSVDGSETAN
jgi:hypothetical protein